RNSHTHSLVLQPYCHHRDLLSFPTRRSSDLVDEATRDAAESAIEAGQLTRREASRLIGDLMSRPKVADEHPAPADAPFSSPFDEDRKSTRLNSSHVKISYAVFCLKKNKHIRR